MNEFVVMVLDAATNPALAGSKALEIRERLASAGLLATGIPRQGARPSAEVVGAASKRVAVGSSLSDLVSEAR